MQVKVVVFFPQSGISRVIAVVNYSKTYHGKQSENLTGTHKISPVCGPGLEIRDHCIKTIAL